MVYNQKAIDEIYNILSNFNSLTNFQLETIKIRKSNTSYKFSELAKIPAINESDYPIYPNYNMLIRYLKNKDLKPTKEPLLWYISITNYRFIDQSKNSKDTISILNTIKTYPISFKLDAFPQVVKLQYDNIYLKQSKDNKDKLYLDILNSENNSNYNIIVNTFDSTIKELFGAYYDPEFEINKNKVFTTSLIKILINLLNADVIPIVNYYMLSSLFAITNEIIEDLYINKVIKPTDENTLIINGISKSELISKLLDYSYYSFKSKNEKYNVFLKTKEWFITNVTMNDIKDVVLLAINLGIKVKYMTKEEVYGFILNILEYSLTVNNVNEIMLLQLKYFLPADYNESLLIQTNPMLSLLFNVKYNKHINYYVEENNIGLIFNKLKFTKEHLQLLSISLTDFMHIVDNSYVEKYIKNLNVMLKINYQKYKLDLAIETYGDEYDDLFYDMKSNDLTTNDYNNLKIKRAEYLLPLREKLKIYKEQLLAKKELLITNVKKEKLENQDLKTQIEKLITIPQNSDFVLKSVNSDRIYSETVIVISISDIYYKHYLLYYTRLINIIINPYTDIYRNKLLAKINKKDLVIPGFPQLEYTIKNQTINSKMSNGILTETLLYNIFTDVELNNSFNIVRMHQNTFLKSKWFLAKYNAVGFFDNRDEEYVDAIDINLSNIEIIKELYKRNLLKLLIYNNEPYIPKENAVLDAEIINHVLNNQVYYIDNDFDYQTVDIDYYTSWKLNWDDNIKSYMKEIIYYYAHYEMLKHWRDDDNKLFFVNEQLIDGKYKYKAFSLQDVVGRISYDKTFVSYPMVSRLITRYSFRELTDILALMENAGLDQESQKILRNIVTNNSNSELTFITKYYKDPVLKELFKLYFATSLWIIHFVRYWAGPGVNPLTNLWSEYINNKLDVYSRNPIVTFLVDYFIEIRDKITAAIEIFEEKENIIKHSDRSSRDWESYIHLLAGTMEKNFMADEYEVLSRKGKLFNKNTLSGVIYNFFYNNYCMGYSGNKAGTMQYTVAYYLEMAKFITDDESENLTDVEISVKSKLIIEQITNGVNLLLKETKEIIIPQLLEKIYSEIELQAKEIPDDLKDIYNEYKNTDYKIQYLVHFYGIVEYQQNNLKTEYDITVADEQIILALNKIKESDKIIKQLKEKLISLRKDLTSLPKHVNNKLLIKHIQENEDRIKDIENRNTRTEMSIVDLNLLPKDIKEYIQTEEKESKNLQNNLQLLKTVSQEKLRELNIYNKKQKTYNKLTAKIKNVMISKRLNLFYLTIVLNNQLKEAVKNKINFENVPEITSYKVNKEERTYLQNVKSIFAVNKELITFYQSYSDPVFFDCYNPLDGDNTIKISRFLTTINNIGFNVNFKVYYFEGKIMSSELEDAISNKFSNIMGSIYNPYSRIYLVNILERFMNLPEKDRNIILQSPELYRQAVRHTTDAKDTYGEDRIKFTTVDDNENLDQFVKVIDI